MSSLLNPLNPDFRAEGYDLVSLRHAAKIMDESTKNIKVNLENFDVGFYRSILIDGEKQYISYVSCRPDYKGKEIKNANEYISLKYRAYKIKLPSILSKDNAEAILKNLQTTKLILSLNNQENPSIGYNHLLVQPVCFKSLSGRQNEIGGSFLGQNTFESAAALQSAVFGKDLPSSFIIRQNKALQTLVGVFSQKYIRININQVLNGIVLLKGNIRHWTMEQNVTRIYFEIPANIKHNFLTPGYVLELSDTGYCSNAISAVWRIKNSESDYYFVQKKYIIPAAEESEIELYKSIREIIEQIFEDHDEFLKKWESLCEGHALEDDGSFSKTVNKWLSSFKADIGIRNFNLLKNNIPKKDKRSVLEYMLTSYINGEQNMSNTRSICSNILEKLMA